MKAENPFYGWSGDRQVMSSRPLTSARIAELTAELAKAHSLAGDLFTTNRADLVRIVKLEAERDRLIAALVEAETTIDRQKQYLGELRQSLASCAASARDDEATKLLNAIADRDISESYRNSYACWSLAIAAMREQRVRSGEYQPINDKERQWASEGPVPVSRLSSVEGE